MLSLPTAGLKHELKCLWHANTDTLYILWHTYKSICEYSDSHPTLLGRLNEGSSHTSSNKNEGSHYSFNSDDITISYHPPNEVSPPIMVMSRLWLYVLFLRDCGRVRRTNCNWATKMDFFLNIFWHHYFLSPPTKRGCDRGDVTNMYYFYGIAGEYGEWIVIEREHWTTTMDFFGPVLVNDLQIPHPPSKIAV